MNIRNQNKKELKKSNLAGSQKKKKKLSNTQNSGH